jgi:hypothetical protein
MSSKRQDFVPLASIERAVPQWVRRAWPPLVCLPMGAPRTKLFSDAPQPFFLSKEGRTRAEKSDRKPLSSAVPLRPHLAARGVGKECPQRLRHRHRRKEEAFAGKDAWRWAIKGRSIAFRADLWASRYWRPETPIEEQWQGRSSHFVAVSIASAGAG